MSWKENFLHPTFRRHEIPKDIESDENTLAYLAGLGDLNVTVNVNFIPEGKVKLLAAIPLLSRMTFLRNIVKTWALEVNFRVPVFGEVGVYTKQSRR